MDQHLRQSRRRSGGGREEDQSRGGLDPKTQMSPLVSDEQQRHVRGTWNRGFSEDAKAVAGGRKLGNRGLLCGIDCAG